MLSPLWDGFLHCNVTAVSPMSMALKSEGCEGTPCCVFTWTGPDIGPADFMGELTSMNHKNHSKFTCAHARKSLNTNRINCQWSQLWNRGQFTVIDHLRVPTCFRLRRVCCVVNFVALWIMQTWKFWWCLKLLWSYIDLTVRCFRWQPSHDHRWRRKRPDFDISGSRFHFWRDKNLKFIIKNLNKLEKQSKD